jgi:hypothetical protein
MGTSVGNGDLQMVSVHAPVARKIIPLKKPKYDYSLSDNLPGVVFQYLIYPDGKEALQYF